MKDNCTGNSGGESRTRGTYRGVKAGGDQEEELPDHLTG